MVNVIDNDVIKAEMEDGLAQVDENLVLSEFEAEFEKESRTLRVYIKATNKETEETIEINDVLG